MKSQWRWWAWLVTTGFAASASAEPFVWFPSDSRRSITCDFTCYAGHRAIDFGLPTSKQVNAGAAGEVTLVRNGIPRDTYPPRQDYGNQVRIRHSNGYLTIYAHLLPNTITVQRGQRVEAGQLLGLSDNTGKSTGPHLHFEVRDPQGKRVNPYGDPPDYRGGCGPGALWATCPPTPASTPALQPVDADRDGFTAAQGDCEDRDPTVHPGVPERCDGRDEDCSGVPDDPWNPRVHEGLAQAIGYGCVVCTGHCAEEGTWVCTPDGRATACDAEPPRPQPERCNGDDDDCDGDVDEDWRSGSTALGRPCNITWDPCHTTTGAWVCAPDGRAVVCDAPQPSRTETCNGIDDDCDGTTDNVAPEQLRVGGYCGTCDQRCAWYETCDGTRCTCTYDICSEHCAALACERLAGRNRCTVSNFCNEARYRNCMSDCHASMAGVVWSDDERACLCRYGCTYWSSQLGCSRPLH